MNRLVLIDGKSVFYRGYYAMGALSLSDGTPTGGVYGFAAIAMEIVKKLNPTKVVVAWDSKTSTAKRKALYDGYKAGRVKPGDDFYTQIPLLEQLVHDLGWNFVELPEYEADDIIGTLSKQADKAGNYETYIISSDLDMLQIVDSNTHMWRILKGFTNIEQIDIPEIEAKYGIKKSQFLDLKSLKGDSSDNIPGVPGIGEKTAAKLLNDYGSLDGVYKHLSDIKGATRAKLEAGKDSAYLSQKLAKIMFNAPVSLADLPDFHFDHDRIISGLRKLEFSSLIRKIEKDTKADFVVAGDQDILTEGPPEPGKARISAPSPWRRATATQPEEEYPDQDPPQVISYDVKYQMHNDQELATDILSGAKTFWDLGQAAFLLNPLMRDTTPQLINPEDEYHTQFVAFQSYPRLYQVLTTLDFPLIPILYKMERRGMLIDRAYFAKLKSEYEQHVAALEQEIYALAGVTFNINSPIQLSDVLFTKWQLPTKGIKKTTKGYSTGAKELDKLKDKHPIINKLIEYREAAKLLSTYIIPIPALADENGRIHTTFTQNVTATGRLSSKDPNLQNIPVRTDEGKRIRTGFIAPSGKVLVSADYSQFELRLAAILSNDQVLISDFNQDVDIHTKTAAEAFGIPMENVTKLQRRAAKVINFGILYGMSIQGLATAADMSIAEAKAFIDNYFKLRAPIKQKLDEILHQAREQGFVETYFGRRRPTPDVKSSNFLIRQAAERAAMNMPIQGTEADLMKRAMINVDKALPDGAELIMQVHDSLIVECDESQAAEVSAILKREMESVAPELKIKLAVEVTTGANWGEL
ncbi:DNA polymerase I [Candidatus Saccharibacteria bacterium]|nr:DNA polymerase I [Candidatus Saccharibacteria bacterium]